MSDGILATDRRGRVRIANDMALKMLGLAKEMSSATTCLVSLT